MTGDTNILKAANRGVQLSIDIKTDSNFAANPVDFNIQIMNEIKSIAKDADVSGLSSRALNETFDYKYTITRDYDFAVEKSEAVKNYFDNMLFIIEEISDPNDKRIEHPLFGVIEDWSTMGGLMQLNVAMQLLNTVYNVTESLPEMGL
eukprot:COSAG01_NODE_33320_length_566_cov_1.098501_1_plen_147_part_01